MGLKGMMADMMMGNMSPEEKQAMMNSMMEKFLADLTPEEKQKMMGDMMDKFMGNMSSGEMQGMMQSVMGGGGSMGLMMDMCRKMMGSMTKTSEPASFAAPEVRGLFEEWATQIEEEILHFIDQSGSNDAARIGERFKLSADSVTFFITRLANKGKINLKAEKNQESV